MLKKTVSFVTDASQGISREIAITFADHGANVAYSHDSELSDLEDKQLSVCIAIIPYARDRSR